jgi:hypothetical protein
MFRVINTDVLLYKLSYFSIDSDQTYICCFLRCMHGIIGSSKLGWRTSFISATMVISRAVGPAGGVVSVTALICSRVLN